MGAADCPFPPERRTSRRTRRSGKSSPALEYVPVRRQHVVQKRAQRCEIEVYFPGRRRKVVGRDTWRHMWSPHWRKSTCRQSVLARFLLADSPPGCNCTSNQVRSVPVPFQADTPTSSSSPDDPFILAIFGLGARHPRPLPPSCRGL